MDEKGCFMIVYIVYFANNANCTSLFPVLYHFMKKFCNLNGLEQWYFSLIWNTYMRKLQTLRAYKSCYYLFILLRDIWHKYHSWYFKIVSNCTRLSALEITYNNFEISLGVFMPNITTNHAITYTNLRNYLWMAKLQLRVKQKCMSPKQYIKRYRYKQQKWTLENC